MMRIGLRGPSNNTANATFGVILCGITTANGTFRSIRQGSEEKMGASCMYFLEGCARCGAFVMSAPAVNGRSQLAL
jgi:hypothetical protein